MKSRYIVPCILCGTDNLFRYDPDKDEIHYYRHALPKTKESCNLMYPGAGPVDSMVNGGDGYLYIGEAFGNLDRLDPLTGAVTELGKPTKHTRLAALEKGPDGRLYGIAGFLGNCHLFAYDTQRNAFETFGRIVDSLTGEPLFIGHDMCFTEPDTIMLGETDTAHRAGYLWECKLN